MVPRGARPSSRRRGSDDMAIWLTKDSKVIVQGMTGSEGSKHTRRMLRAGTHVVGGVTPGKGGQKVDFDGTTLPVFNSVGEAMGETGADVTVIFVPPKFAKAAVVEAVDAGSRSRWSSPRAFRYTTPPRSGPTTWPAASRPASSGPNCPGVASPGAIQRRHHPGRHLRPRPHRPGLKSGTLTYQMMYELRDIGFSTVRWHRR